LLLAAVIARAQHQRKASGNVVATAPSELTGSPSCRQTCLYALASLLLFIGFVAAVIACQRDGSPCKTAGSTHANVSMAFAFFAFLELLASAWLAWSAHSSGGGAAAYSSEGGYA
jgi:hypothetical protein